MAGSPFFVRIKFDVLKIMSSVPEGRLVTFQDIGQHIDVISRHVAYILSQLKGDEQAATPWFRAVAENGILSDRKINEFKISQRQLLTAERHLIAPDGRILNFGQVLVAVDCLNSGVPVQKRPPDAPKSKTSGKRRQHPAS